MPPERRRFAAALALFVAWVGCLVALATVSSRPPAEAPKPAPAAKAR